MPYPTNPTPTQINEQLGTVEIFEAFNNKANNGIALIKKTCGDLGLDETQQRSQIAAFIVEHKANLKDSEVFDYVTSPGEENKAVLSLVTSEYSQQMIGQEFVPALRGFVQSLPLAGGEAQKIDRYVKAFAEEYARHNPTKLANSDAAYTMAFSTIMLNTDAHSNQVANKMDFKHFVNNNKGMNNGGDFDRAFLKSVYDEIQKTELKLSPRERESSFTMASDRLKNDALFSSITKELGKKTPNLKGAIGIDGAEVSISNKKPWYSFLTGHKSTVTITKDGAQVTLEVSNPGLFSKNKQPSAIVKPTATKDNPLPQREDRRKTPGNPRSGREGHEHPLRRCRKRGEGKTPNRPHAEIQTNRRIPTAEKECLRSNPPGEETPRQGDFSETKRQTVALNAMG
jgi:Sec7-like guanine-nucleotide exchange factor